jgi:hypothetical protein
MPNQKPSHSKLTSSGVRTTILNETWERLVQINHEAGVQYNPEAIAALKYTFFQGAMATYNLMIESIRQDSSLHTLMHVSAALQTEVDEYFTAKSAEAQARASKQH